MKVKAVIPSVKEVEFEAPNEITVQELERIICKKLNIEPELTRLLLDGAPLREDEGLKAKSDTQIRVIVDYYWARSLILWGLEAQKALQATSAFIAGAGALGCEVAENLAMLGVGELTIVDHDLIELSNLSRMAPYRMGDLGEPKALVIRDKLVEKHPSLSMKSLERRVEEIPKSILLNSDIILSCLDNLPSRIYLASIAVKYSIPMVDAGIVGYQGRIQSFIPPKGPCPTCIIPEAQYPQLAELRNPCTPDMNDEAIPSLPTSNKLVSSVQSHEALKIILSTKEVPNEVIGEPLKDPLIIDLKYNRYTVMPVKKNNKCIVCGKDGIAKEKSIRLELSRETTTSPTKILKKIKEVEDLDKNDYAILVEDGAAFKKVRRDRWNEAVKMARGKYIYVVFKNKGSDEYKEAAIKLPN